MEGGRNALKMFTGEATGKRFPGSCMRILKSKIRMDNK